MDRDHLCRVASEVISGAFHVLTIRILLLDSDRRTLALVTSTYDGEATDLVGEPGIPATPAMREGIGRFERAFDLDDAEDGWIASLCEACPKQFPHGGKRIGVPLRAADRVLGVMVLADRVKGISYTQEERDLLICLGDQLAAGDQSWAQPQRHRLEHRLNKRELALLLDSRTSDTTNPTAPGLRPDPATRLRRANNPITQQSPRAQCP